MRYGSETAVSAASPHVVERYDSDQRPESNSRSRPAKENATGNGTLIGSRVTPTGWSLVGV
jgi:hypothetical protein